MWPKILSVHSKKCWVAEWTFQSTEGQQHGDCWDLPGLGASLPSPGLPPGAICIHVGSLSISHACSCCASLHLACNYREEICVNAVGPKPGELLVELLCLCCLYCFTIYYLYYFTNST